MNTITATSPSPNTFFDRLEQALPVRNWESFWDFVHFLIRFAQNPLTVGSIAPSSIFLAKKIVKLLPTHASGVGRHYLEVGAGTGVFTEEIIKRLKNHDQLDIVEVDPEFCEILRKKYAAHNVRVHCGPIEEWRPAYKYDHLVSGLPLNGFSPEQVSNILTKLRNLTKINGTISYFEYIALPSIKSICLEILARIGIISSEYRNNFQKVLEIKELFYKTHGRMQEVVYLNALPARVFHLQIQPGN